MRAIHLPSFKPLKLSKFLLLGIAVGLIAIHLSLNWRLTTDFNQVLTRFLIWVAVCYRVWNKRDTFTLKSSFPFSFLGTFLIALLLIKSTSPTTNLIHISPLISAGGLSLIASGFKGLKQYSFELIILLLIGLPYVTILGLVDLSELTAKFAAFILFYLGFEVSRQGVNITLPTGIVEVYPACSGMKNILEMWEIALLVLLMFPLDGRKKFLVPVAAIFLGFVVNGVRVAVMAHLTASSNEQAFEYWHTGDGSLIFSMISFLIFWLFCHFLLRLDESENQNSAKF